MSETLITKNHISELLHFKARCFSSGFVARMVTETRNIGCPSVDEVGVRQKRLRLELMSQFSILVLGIESQLRPENELGT